MVYPRNSGYKEVEYLPMTRGQKWLSDEILKMKYPGWAAIEFSVKTKVAMDEDALKESTGLLLDKYENLRVKIYKRNEQWVQELCSLSGADVFAVYDLSSEDQAKKLEKVKQICTMIREWFSPAGGNLFRIIFFKFSEREGRLWFYMHHLISDFVSALLVSGDFLTFYNHRVEKRENRRQPARDYRKWMYTVEGYSRDVILPSELDYWLSLPWDKARVLPSDYPEKFNDDTIVDAIDNKRMVNSYRIETCAIEDAETLRLFNKYGNDFETVLIAAFFLALATQMKVNCLDISASYSGRNVLPASYEMSDTRLVGFLADVRVLLLKNPGSNNIRHNIEAVVEQIKSIPNRGMGYFLISQRMDNGPLKNRFLTLRSKAQIFFNYLGKASTTISNAHYELVKEDIGQDDRPQEIKNSILECVAGINQGRLNLTLTFIEEYHKAATVKEVLHQMTVMLRSCIADHATEKVA